MGTLKWVPNSGGKRAISVRAIEVLLYATWYFLPNSPLYLVTLTFLKAVCCPQIDLYVALFLRGHKTFCKGTSDEPIS